MKLGELCPQLAQLKIKEGQRVNFRMSMKSTIPCSGKVNSVSKHFAWVQLEKSGGKFCKKHQVMIPFGLIKGIK